MHTAMWMSYDLGVKGDYEGLYAWLDDHDAKECGNSVAFLRYEYSADFETIASIPGLGMAPVGHLSYSAGPNM